MSVTLSIISDLDAEVVNKMTFDLCQTINRETDISADLPPA